MSDINAPYICSQARARANAAATTEAGGVRFELGFLDAEARQLERDLRAARLERDRYEAAHAALGNLLDALDDAGVDACGEHRAKAAAAFWAAIGGASK